LGVNDLQFLRGLNDQKPVTAPLAKISEYVEGKRILPPNTPFPGFWRNSRTPYAVEIMDNMGPFSPVRESSIMKGAQVGLTACAENVIAYWMDESPSEILYISSTESLLIKWATKRLEPLIDSCGYRNKIFAQVENTKTRRSGDKTFSKEYIGGTLDMASAQSAASLRSDSKRILIRDEVDGAPAQLRTGEGNWLDVSQARTNAWGARKKIMNFSTPTTTDNSIIAGLYEDGDQRKYFVPCPICGKFQTLEFGNEQSEYGCIKADFEAGRLKEAYYICDYCHEAVFNHSKNEMLNKGEWRATAKTDRLYHHSYHLSSLYSPVGMLSWTEMYDAYLKALKDPKDGMRSFTNLYLGLPFVETGTSPDAGKVLELRGGYRSGKVPKGVLYITSGVDVQRGSEKDPANPARLEMEILGIGSKYRTWSIAYKRFEGAIDDPAAGAWEKLTEWIQDGNLNFEGYNQAVIPCTMMFIDSGDGIYTDVVYDFAKTAENIFPSKGFSKIKAKKGEQGDILTDANFKRYRALKVGSDLTLYEIATNYYKKNVYRNLRVPRVEVGGPQRPGFCEFPLDYGEKYFKMLVAEQMRVDGSFHCPKGRRNEALDCRVYALCAADVWLDARVMDYKAAAKSAGATPAQLTQMNHRTYLEILCKKQGLQF